MTSILVGTFPLSQLQDHNLSTTTNSSNYDGEQPKEEHEMMDHAKNVIHNDGNDTNGLHPQEEAIEVKMINYYQSHQQPHNQASTTNSNNNSDDNNNVTSSEQSLISSSTYDERRTTATTNIAANQQEHHHQQQQPPRQQEPPPLTSSSRLMGYFCLFLLSCLSFVAAYESDGIHKLSNFLSANNKSNNNYTNNTNNQNKYLFQVVEAVPASSSGRYYALVVSGVSAVSNFIIMMMHYFDYFFYHHCHCNHISNNNSNDTNNNNNNHNHHTKTTLRSLFKPSSIFEFTILLFSCTWWIIGVAILTSIRGPAGDGKGQFNLYFSTWLSCIISIHMMEEWLIAAPQYSSVFQMISSWPNRAPGWIRIFVMTLANVLCIFDLLHRHNEVIDVAPDIAEKYDRIDVSQWSWLIFVCVISFTTALGFSIVELFRRSSSSSSSTSSSGIVQGMSTGTSSNSGNDANDHSRIQNNDDDDDDAIDGIKGGCESQIEGILLAFLVIIWLPSVVIATTDDGVASDFGNTYFFTWGSTIVVIQTFITWLQDWRKSVHEASRQLHLEYDRNKEISNRNNNESNLVGSRRFGGVDDDDNESGNNHVQFSHELQDFLGRSVNSNSFLLRVDQENSERQRSS